jgi:hypothetical protein
MYFYLVFFGLLHLLFQIDMAVAIILADLGAARVLVHDQVLDLLTNRRELYAYFFEERFYCLCILSYSLPSFEVPPCLFCTATAFVCAQLHLVALPSF